MEKVITNPNRIRNSSAKTGQNSNLLNYDEKFVQSGAVLSLKTKVLAVSIFLFFFIENGTLGLLPRDFYYVYRNVRISDLILYVIIIYSLFCIREYIVVIFSFMKFISNSDYYADALESRLFQGGDDVQYNEGTYGVRVLQQNNDLLRLWLKNNVIVGIEMHPMWVYKPESLEEQKCNSAFSDITWPAVLAAYGIIGVILAGIFQFYYIKTTFKLILASGNPNINTFILVLLFAKLIFDTFVNFSYCLFSFGLIGISSILCLQIAVLVLTYENKTNNNASNTVKSEIEFAYNKRKYYYSFYKTYKLQDYTR